MKTFYLSFNVSLLRRDGIEKFPDSTVLAIWGVKSIFIPLTRFSCICKAESVSEAKKYIESICQVTSFNFHHEVKAEWIMDNRSLFRIKSGQDEYLKQYLCDFTLKA